MCTGLNGYVLVYFIQAIFRSAIQICKNKLLLYISCACTMLRFGLIHVYGMYTYIYIYIYIYVYISCVTVSQLRVPNHFVSYTFDVSSMSSMQNLLLTIKLMWYS